MAQGTVVQLLLAQALGPLARDQGDSDLAWALVGEGLPAGGAADPGEGLHYFPVLGVQRLAAALALDAGDLPTALGWLEAHDRWLDWNGTVLGRSEGQALWARYHRAAGDLALACKHAERALAHAAEPRQPLALLAAHRLLGELATEAGRHAEAPEYLDQALDLAEACVAPYERALTLLALAELRAATGKRNEARALLDEVRAICAPLGAEPALARAEALAARLAVLKPPRERSPAGLTAWEVEVLRLIAAGHSNREIAAALCLSVRTVERHIENLYAKTATRSKADATAYAFRHHLT